MNTRKELTNGVHKIIINGVHKTTQDSNTTAQDKKKGSENMIEIMEAGNGELWRRDADNWFGLPPEATPGTEWLDDLFEHLDNAPDREEPEEKPQPRASWLKDLLADIRAGAESC